jgi:dihydropteroate synthase
MHMQGTPQDMQASPAYADVVGEVTDFLRARLEILDAAGVARERVTIDPGFGFGKTVEHNVALLQGISRMRDALGLPVLAGLSRKSMIGAITGRPLEQRLAGSLGGALAAIAQGARIVRVHDVAETVDALRVWQAGTRNN